MNRYLTVNNMRRLVKGMLLVAAFCLSTPMWADIVIGGNVYGGGKQGAVGTANTTATNSTEAENVTLTDASSEASQVTINSGSILAVFGGGEQGRSYGVTKVNINNGTIGVENSSAAANGNVFGAGDGSDAVTFGGSVLTIAGGTIGHNVYGGGNEANLIGTTTVDLKGGTYKGDVYGGSKIADIYGRTFVNINGASLTADMNIANVYGGNDISGTVTPADATTYPNWTWAQQDNMNLPFTLASTGLTVEPSTVVNKSWNAFILATKSTSYQIRINNLYGGGNGDYNYTSGIYEGKNKPELERVYLQIEGGVFGNLYGGGNAATVTQSTDICLVNDDSHNYVDSYQFDRVFGGNNKAAMDIRPNWYLKQARINNLYSGGNAGAMTYYDSTNEKGGILIAVESADMTVNNVYGGCRMADVVPSGTYDSAKKLSAETLYDTPFQEGYAARVLIKGGNINNVYGGNDVSGNVYYGSQVEILSSINGDVYGAGNGSYAYTDNFNLKGDKVYGDYYYDGGAGGLASAQALSIHRPNAAQSYVHVTGTDADHYTYIGGAIYCGGNSATLRSLSGSLKDAKAELHIGSYVIADNVFLGSNGENMVKSETADDLLRIYKNGPVGFDNAAKGNYSSMDLTDSDQFEEYMRGVEVAIKPTVTFDAGYVSHSTKFGSLYCGGNVGSMSADGYFNIDFLQKLVIYDKLVGGCNNANVAKTDYNAFHMGGLTGNPDANNNKVLLTIAGLQLEPRVLTGNVQEGFHLDQWNKNASGMLQGGNIYGGCYSSGYINGGVNIDIQQNAISPDVFNYLAADVANPETGVSYNDVRDDVLASTLAAYGGGYGKETEIWGNVTVSITGVGQIMKAYGGGEMGVVGKLDRYKADDEIPTGKQIGDYMTDIVQEWYSETTDQDLHGYTTPVTEYKSRNHSVAKFDTPYNATVNLNANLLAEANPNVAKLYGGGFQGTVSGKTTANLNKGRVYDAFGGASNADILGHAETYVGKESAPTITHNVYGANDFGGLIVGHNIFLVDNNKDGDNNDTMEKIVAQSYVEYNSGSIAGDLFGGPCGAYEYDNDSLYAAVIATEGFCRPQLLEDLLTDGMLTPLSGAGYAANSFVNIISQSTLASDKIAGSIFGAGQGLKGRIKSADERGSYVRLASATANQRRTTGVLSSRVYGAGYCSNTNRSLVDAFTGYHDKIFGGAHGITYKELTEMELTNPTGGYETNYMGYRSAVRLHQMTNNQMDIYGGGANAGAEETSVVLNGGQARYVYGASYAQGITYAASVEIPENSTSMVRAIFGGAEGGSDEYPCDAYNTFVTWNSENARVQDALYGGNNAYRMTRNAYVSVSKPVRDTEGNFKNVFGGGYGENTVTLYTEVNMLEGAQVANVYGGGNDGKVLDTPSFRYYLDDGELYVGKNENNTDITKRDIDNSTLKVYPTSLNNNTKTPSETTLYGYQKYLRDSEVIGFHNWIVQHCWDGNTKDSRNQPLGSYTANAHGHAHPVYFLSTQMDNMKNTNVFINKGAIVAENAYGGGLGAKATVSGETSVKLWGGIVKGDIYGGGFGGDVKEYSYLIFPAGGQHELTMASTHVNMQGGSARNVYGGGLNGHVVGSTDVVLGTKDKNEYDFYGTTISGQYENRVYQGDPIVERSLYGGGENGHVYGTAYLTLNQGHVGYKYDASAEVDGNSTDECYVENLDLKDSDDNLLSPNGNVFGAGYGPGATVDVTYVNIYGGTIRNSLYGGGEIAAVGRADMNKTVEESPHPEVGTFHTPGHTHVYMYKGLVQGDVFGGGRGYSYDLTGQEQVDQEYYTSGYVFGTTEVEIRGGVIGTLETVANGQGNVFGGGNIGYCFTDAQKHDDGRYYTNAWKCDECGHIHYQHGEPTTCLNELCRKSINATDSNFKTTFTKVLKDGTSAGDANEYILSEDCRVVISPWAQVKGEKIEITGNNKSQPDGSILATRTFKEGEYVPTAYLNLLKDKNTDEKKWKLLSDAGVTVRNAIFAGGNVSAGSDKIYANAKTVYGNSTASVNDVFFRDFITLGTEHTGGLYGDGNLTFVDGYRELNITNFGTDYYGQQDQITKAQYDAMNDRERAYFMLEYQAKENHTYYYYVCNEDHNYNNVTYTRGQHISTDDYDAIKDDGEKSKWTSGQRTFNPSSENDRIKESEWKNMTAEEQLKWEEFGFCSIYAGRLLNTIQRADFCGVFGSRLVLQGAQDRVPEVVDYTQYTINRVSELSLNKKEYEGPDKGDLTAEALTHGNYFGMYNIVNYLGALTSDVDFDNVRTTDNDDASYKEAVDGKNYGEATYYDWKKGHQGDRKRNNGTSHNTVALAAGVYLEIVKEPTTTVSKEDRLDPYKKNWGYITGIVQLDLINVMTGIGGGYVYAKNEHGTRSGNPGSHKNLSIYNLSAVNNSAYTYSNTDELIETSGNFIHNTKQIVDDCFPRGGDLDQPAHYWYIRGEFYIYDQYISAYTGSSTAYQENINLPLTITAGANGRLDLIDIKQNYYAYYKNEGDTPMTASDAIVVNAKTYGLNDIITWWDYMQLNDEQKKHFVKETYVATMDYCTSNSFDSEGKPANVISKGEVVLPGDSKLKATYYNPEDIITNNDGTKSMKTLTARDVFHVSNAVSHENGYVLAVKLDNPGEWDSWYSPLLGSNKINQTDYNKATTTQTNYLMGPTYYTETAGVYGQHEHVLDEIVTQSAVTAYNAISTLDNKALENLENAGKHQATVSAAYVAVTAAEYDYDHDNDESTPKIHKNLQAGVGISAEEYATLDNENKAKFSPAYTCLSTFEEDASNAEYIYFGTLISATKYQELRTQVENSYKAEHTGASTEEVSKYVNQVMSEHFDKAYIVTSAGYYGGQYFESGKNYRALDTWATLTSDDRKKFQFRYDALDALLFSNTSKEQGYYPATATDPETGYYPGTGEEGPGENNIYRYDGPYWDGTDASPLHRVYGDKQPIDYTAKYNGDVALTWTDAAGNNHTLSKTDAALTREAYENLPNEKRHYSAFNVDVKDKVGDNFPTYYIVKETFISGGTNYATGKTISADTYNSFDDTRRSKIQTFTPTAAGIYYICRESYTIDEKGMGKEVTDIRPNGAKYTTGEVPSGVIINSDNYNQLVNKQLAGFTIIGNSPIETSTFYVNRESNIFDLSKDRVVTVMYQYKYEESDESGQNVEEITERHIINIHISFKSGVPTIGKLQDPSIVLPGQTVGLKSPGVTPGAYEILGAGWELFTNADDAEKHTNGKTYINNATPMYWYQDGYYVAYFAKTYLGKTYSNSVPFKVANYHDIADVMADNQNYMYIDHPDVKRNPKIYISDNVVDNLIVTHNDAVDAGNNPVTPVKRTESEIDMLYSLFQNSLATSKKKVTVDVQDQEKDASGNLLYWEVVDGKPSPTQKTTTVNNYPVQLYWEVDDSGNKDESKPKTTTITAYPATHPEDQYVSVFNDEVRNLQNLEFYLMDNVATKQASWNPIGGENAACFSGNLHGNGHTISGLNNSLFGSLCGNVYNLGVTGSFSSPGIADAGDGYMENCWVSTTATLANTVRPIFAHSGEGNHLVNGYYVDTQYTATNAGAKAMPLQSFYNGEVAYNLNGFYLAKRYADNTSSISTNSYKYLVLDSEGNVNTDIKTGYYDMGAYYGTAEAPLGYVENLYYDGDYIYKDGIIPENVNERKKGTVHLPIWPDDYVFFGQMLTYGYDETNNKYQDMPSVINKTDNKTTNRTDRIIMGEDGSNRVFRVPAYYRNSTMSDAYHNVNAYFVAKTKDGSKDIHEGMTAIDFTGKNDVENGYKNGWNNDDMFYAPVLDNSYAKLLGFNTEGLTQNLLVYVDDNDVANATSKMYVVKEALDGDIDYQEGNPETYRTVAAASESEIVGVKGHLVIKSGDSYVAQNDHFLVDKQEFNAPIEYKFASGKRMWYQRTPELYATLDNKGWEGISLPFTVDLVTTPKKGEITHFYGDSNKGHEYWLRGYAGATYVDKDSDGNKLTDSDGNNISLTVVQMNRPSADNSTDTKTVSNSFLWDYYYSKRAGVDGVDANTDDYQQNYYNAARNYEGYAHQQAGVPYIVGFPGSDYYEFDLSGTFVPQNSGTTTPAKLAPQVITFASATGANINVSDTVMAQAVSVEGQAEENGATVKKPSGYSFKPNYLATNLAENSYVMNAEGDAFEIKASAVGVPFRPYFEVTHATPASPAPARTKALASKLVIGNSDSDTDNPGSAMADGTIRIWSENNTILIENNSSAAAMLTVYTSGGQLIKHVNVPSKGREVVKVNGRGIYLVGNTKVIVK